ncbi:LuxR family transcriptional regulator [Bradyrhizobium prioriisuperbiae]|uniref:helix-turn-helix transcriptional regulator n=1 Tax=Bradyrhizobium prioriisuperbiae TaxID=2854389 RepID=UPI0028E33E0D|nr:LuxR family transcriptional regulator [Bradyrhizobium prioritasuperba]
MIGPELLSSVIDMIYEATSEPSRWQDAIDQVRILFHGSAACFVRSGPNLAPTDMINANPDPTYQRRYIEEHAGRPEIYADALEAAPVGTIYSDHALIGDDILRQSRFWNEWMAPQDMYGGLGSKLLASGPSFWFLDVQRGRNQQAFDAADAELLKFVVQHIARAADLSHRIQSAQALISSYAHLPVGVLLVDAQLRIAHVNEVAEDILMRQGSQLRVKSGVLATADARHTAALQQFVADVCTVHDGVAPGRGGDLLLRASGADGPGIDVALTVGPMAGKGASPFLQPRHAVIYLREVSLALPGGFEDHARQLFDLTPAEARLSAALASGLVLKDAAIHQGIRYSTARSYLEGIFRKTRTNQQSQLVALLKSTQPLIPRR